jgi:hypothetical protein
MTRQDMLTQFRSMPREEQLELLEEMQAAVGYWDLDGEQVEEIRRRVGEIDRGEAKLVPFEQAMQQIRAKHSK